MIGIRRKVLNTSFCSSNVEYPASETTQNEPTLHDILVRYQNGLDVSQYIHEKAAQATADLQFMNKLGKVDPLTEIPAHIRKLAAREEADLKNKVADNSLNDNEKKVDDVQANVVDQSNKTD